MSQEDEKNPSVASTQSDSDFSLISGDDIFPHDHFGGSFEAILLTDLLVAILQILTLSGEDRTWTQLAFMTCKNVDLVERAKRMMRPLVVRIAIDSANAKFVIPFRQARVARVRIEWGDGEEQRIAEVGGTGGVAEHRYAQPGDYCVRVFPDGEAVNGSWLDHLGWKFESSKTAVDWWRRIVSIDQLGSLGIRSLEYLFLDAFDFNKPLQSLLTIMVWSLISLNRRLLIYPTSLATNN